MMNLVRTFLLSLTFLGLGLGLVSCTKKENFDGKMLNIAIVSTIKGYDPIYANDRYSANEVARVYEGLLHYNYVKRPFTLVPNLAESLPKVSKDGLVYTFKIKKGITFQDDAAFQEGKGRELIAQDFVYSLKRLADPKLQGLGWWLLQGRIVGLNEWRQKYSELPETDYNEEVEGLKAIDKYTLQFTLKEKFPQFLYGLAMPFTFVVAKEVVDKYGKEFLNHPVGTGAFKIEGGEFKQNKKIRYVKSPNYRDETFPCDASEEYAEMAKKNCGKKLPFVDAITVKIMEESQPRWLNFQKGRVDYLTVPKDNFDSAIPDAKNLAPDFKEKGMGLIVSPALDVTYSGFNHDLELFKGNKKLRQAMSLAYDGVTANRLFYSNQAIPAQSIVPPGISGYMNNFENPYRGKGTEEDIAKAKKLLAEAGYPEGKGLPDITYDCPVSTTSFQMAEFFRDQMKKIGINVKVLQNPFPELQRKITRRSIMMYGIAWGADYPDAENFLQLLYGPNKAPGANGSGYDNSEFNRLFKVASIMQDSPERTALYEKMNRMVAEEMPLIYGVHRQTFVVKHGWIKNYVATDFDSGIGKYIDVDEELKTEIMDKL